MLRGPSLSRFGLSVALGLLLASASGPLRASSAAVAGSPAARRFELITADRVGELPPALRAPIPAPSLSEALGLPETTGSHTVHLRWVVREGRRLFGYRVTLVSAVGLPGHLAARWWVAPAAGTPLSGGLTAYSAELGLAIDEPAPIVAAIEAIDLSGHAFLLGVRRSVAESEPASPSRFAAWPAELSAFPNPVPFSRAAPSAQAAAQSSPLLSSPPEADAKVPLAAFAPNAVGFGSVSGRGPPSWRLTSSLTGA